MPSQVPPHPLFDADNHLYESQEAMTRYLPREYAGAIQYVQVNGRTKIAVRGQISEYIPNPVKYIDVLNERTALTEENKAKVMGGNLARLIAA